VCTGVDLQECARIANLFALETAVKEEEIERLTGMLERCLSREDENSNHDNILEIGDAAKSRILEPMETVDNHSDGTHLLMLLRKCKSLLSSFSSIYIVFGTGLFRHPLSDLLVFHAHATHFSFRRMGECFLP